MCFKTQLFSQRAEKLSAPFSKHCSAALSRRQSFSTSPPVTAFATGPVFLCFKTAPYTVPLLAQWAGQGAEGTVYKGKAIVPHQMWRSHSPGRLYSAVAELRKSWGNHPVVGQPFLTLAVGAPLPAALLEGGLCRKPCSTQSGFSRYW